MKPQKGLTKMSDTKACSLTEDEIWALLQYHARQIVNTGPNYEAPIERLNYLNKRLSAFKEPEVNEPKTGAEAPKTEAPAVAGWGTPVNG